MHKLTAAVVQNSEQLEQHYDQNAALQLCKQQKLLTFIK